MNRRTLYGLLVVGAFVIGAGAWKISSAQSFSVQPPPPAGVAPSQWISISGKLGFVVEPQLGAFPRKQPQTINGYFVVRRDGRWRRVQTVSPQSRPLT